MSTSALPVHVGVIDETGQIPVSELQRVVGALSEQVTDEFYKDWHVLASVGLYTVESVPQGCWTVRIQATLNEPGALGFHTDNHGQPIAYVMLTDGYPQTVSHETLEMLVDPWGWRMHSAAPPQGIDSQRLGLGPNDRVEYLVEACDPCESASYPVGGVMLSDYMLNRWYRSAPGRNAWFSHLGTCTAPRQVADGGYVSFARADHEWFQVFNEGGRLQLEDIGRFDKAQHSSLREFTDAKAREYRARN